MPEEAGEKQQIQCPYCRVMTPRPRHAITATCSNCGKSVAMDDRVFDRRYVFGGEVLTRGKITVGPQGLVKANLSATDINIEGTVEGNVTAVERLSLGQSATLLGDAVADKLRVAEGANLRGRFQIGQPEKP